MPPHLKLGIFGSKTVGPSARGAAEAEASGAGSLASFFEQAESALKTRRAARVVVGFIGVLVLACEPSRPQAKPTAPLAARYLAIGDSFTIGTGSSPSDAFPARLVERWRAHGCNVELKNVAVNGYTSADVVREELPVIETFRPTFITVAVGANDIVQARSEDEYRASLRRIFSEATRAAPVHVVALPQPDWSKSPASASFGDREAIAMKIRRYDAILAEEAIASGARFIDERPEPGVVARDGLHPSAAAHDAWANAIVNAMASSDACRSSL